MQDAIRTHTEAGFRVDRDPVTGKLSIGDIVYGQSGTEVTLPFNGNTISMSYSFKEDKSGSRARTPTHSG